MIKKLQKMPLKYTIRSRKSKVSPQPQHLNARITSQSLCLVLKEPSLPLNQIQFTLNLLFSQPIPNPAPACLPELPQENLKIEF